MKRRIIDVLVVILLTTLMVNATPVGIMVAAYFTPGAKWDAMDWAATRVPVIAIMNPFNGPGASQSSSYISAISNLHQAGGKVIGYLYSSYGARPLAEVEADIDTYLNWYAVDGFFVDEMANDANINHLNYYAALYQYIKSKNSQFSVTGNPGSNTQEGYLLRPTADILMNFENNGTNYPTYIPSSWVNNYSPGHFVHLPYDVAGAATMSNYVSLAISRNAGWVYISDLTTYSELPTYWTNEVNFLQSLNGVFTPYIPDYGQPADRTAAIGDAVTFQVTAFGPLPMTCQWFFETNALANATNPFYPIGSVLPAHAGSYHVQVSNSNGVTSSRAALLAIKMNTYRHIAIDGSFGDWTNIPLAAIKPQVAGDVVSFQSLYVANDEDYLYLRFRLYSPANPFTSKQNIFFDMDTNPATGYSENGLGSEMLVQSGSAYRQTNGVFNVATINGLNWQASPAAPASEFEVRVSRNVTYANGVSVFGTNTVAIFLETGENSGNKWFPDVSGGLLYTFSQPPFLSITNPAQPLDQYVVQGRSVTFNVAASGSAVVQYQWYQAASAINGASNAFYTIAAVDLTNAGSYYAAVSNPAGLTNSRAALLTVLRDTVAPAVTNIAATARQVIITFSEALDAASISNLANYSLSGGATVTNAVISGQTVTLTTGTALSLGTVYSLAVNGVRDMFGNVAHTTVSLAPSILITVDGNISDWAGIPPLYSAPSGVEGAADFKDVYVFNDAHYYYFRITLWHDIPPANGFFPKYCNMFYNTDGNSASGYSAIGSEFLQQSSSFYQERGGTFSSEGQVLVGMATGYLIRPAVRETSFPADFEWRYPRNATFSAASGGGLVFSTNWVSFLWQGQTPEFVAQNTVPSGGGVLTYTNAVQTVVPSLPLGQLGISVLPNGKMALVWDAAATLQASGSLGADGSWTNVPAATSPYIPSSGGQLFFRLSQ